MTEISPDAAALAADLELLSFVEGVDRGHWALEALDGTLATFTITDRYGRSIGIRLDCSGYPSQPPAGQLWSVKEDRALPAERWPTGGRASEVFNPAWSRQTGGGFYFPYDRTALNGHDPWRTDNPEYVWDDTKTVVDALWLLRDVLRSATGPQEGDEAVVA